MSDSKLTSIFGELKVDTAAAQKFLGECQKRADAGEKLDYESVLEEARYLITASIHPTITPNFIVDPDELKNRSKDLDLFPGNEGGFLHSPNCSCDRPHDQSCSGQLLHIPAEIAASISLK